MKKFTVPDTLLFGMAIIAFATTFIISCSKEDIAKVEGQQLSINITENNIMVFNSDEEFFRTIDKIALMDDAQLDTWESEQGFSSIRSINNQIMDELEFMETEEEVYELVSRYSEYCEIIINDDGEEELSFFVDDKVYSAIANTEGYYVIGETVNKVIDEIVVTADIDKFSELETIDRDNIDKIEDNKDITMFGYVLRTSEKTGCGSSYLTATRTRDDSGCSNDRQVRLYMQVIGYSVYSGYSIKTTVMVRGYKKFVCIWGRYTTGLEYKDVSGVVLTKDGNVSFRFDNLSDSSTRELYNEIQIASYTGSYQGYHYFVDAFGTTTSTGVGNIWATIDCH